MCGIFGQISKKNISKKNIKKLSSHSQQRGKDSSGLIYFDKEKYNILRSELKIKDLLAKANYTNSSLLLGHSRLITNGLNDNQPVIKGDIAVIHNGIIVNENEAWSQLNCKKEKKIDSELIVAIANEHLENNGLIEDIPKKILSICKGVIACVIIMPSHGKLMLFSNNGSLYSGEIDEDIYFSSENYPLDLIECKNIKQIKSTATIIDINVSNFEVIYDQNSREQDLIPEFSFNKNKEKLLQYDQPELQRCSKCVLPETMPYIKFDNDGVCNYCISYKKRNNPKPKKELLKIIEPYRRNNQIDCIVPFSGGRDSCFALHIIVNELNMNPLTYTYDWGMVTDLGRRNISRMSADLGVENIIIAADISKKRDNIRKNLNAWLKHPHLGLMALLTAGDKHFFRHVETVKKQSGVNLNLWGVNPLEVTHFKTGFLGIRPDFEEEKVYSNGALKQLNYHSKRFKAMLGNLDYFNKSIWDTLSGEYYRSFTNKKDYYHIFDFIKWDEKLIESTLDKYD